jgi:hypothetical protein
VEGDWAEVVRVSDALCIGHSSLAQYRLAAAIRARRPVRIEPS